MQPNLLPLTTSFVCFHFSLFHTKHYVSFFKLRQDQEQSVWFMLKNLLHWERFYCCCCCCFDRLESLLVVTWDNQVDVKLTFDFIEIHVGIFKSESVVPQHVIPEETGVTLNTVTVITCDSVNYPSLLHFMLVWICLTIFLNKGYWPIFSILLETNSIKHIHHEGKFLKKSNLHILSLNDAFSEMIFEMCLVVVKKFFLYVDQSGSVFF